MPCTKSNFPLEEQTYFVSATSFNPPPPPEEDKDHGRNILNRLVGVLSSLFQKSRKQGYTSTITDEASDIDSPSRNEEVEYYRDDFNDESWSCSFGTGENDGIWMNREDPPGTILSMTVAVLICE